MSNQLMVQMAQRFCVPESEMLATLKATAFKGHVSDAQMTALLVVANQYNLNPWTKEIYAFPDTRNGIVPIVGVDGWSRIINDNPAFDGMDFEQDDESCTCRIYRKDRSHAIAVTEYMSECKRSGQTPWQSHPKRMLRHKAMIQCARLAFGYSGIYDPDEAERIGEAQSASLPEKSAEYLAFESENLQSMRDAAMDGMDALLAAFNALPKSELKTQFWAEHGTALKKCADDAVVIAGEAQNG